MFARFTTSLMVLAAGSVLSGGCATSHYTQSRIEVGRPDAEGPAGSAVSFEIDGLRVAIQTLDRAPEPETIPRLRLRLVLDPDELGYSFDPGQVVLRTGDGGEWRAAESRYVPVNPKSAFELAFDARVEPEARVELELGGLARGTKRLEPVTLRLFRQRGRSIDRLYWLEAIGYGLAALTYPYGGM